MNLMKRIFIILGVGLLLAAGAFVLWGLNPLPAMPEALGALQSSGQVEVVDSPWMTFTPREKPPTLGVILYPGGHVDPRAYAPPARAIAAAGYLVVIPPMPLNLAVFAPERADEVIAAHPEIQHWVIGGHSLGGAMAAEFTASHPESVAGLLLWASYSAESRNLSQFEGLPVMSIYGTEDGGADGIRTSGDRLPEDTTWVEMEGGNHAQFGWYGDQPGDGEARISREAQQAQIVQATLEFLNSIETSQGKP